jgi:hypothetical protein
MGTRDNKITTNTETKSRQKRTRNKRHIKEEDKRIEDENGHRGRKKKVPELIITKPASCANSLDGSGHTRVPLG